MGCGVANGAMRAMAALAGGALAAAAPAQTPMEDQVLAMLNAVRADPAAFAGQLRTFRGFFRANYYVLPGRAEQNVTEEGVAAVDDAIRFLAGQRQLRPVDAAPMLAAAAADHVAEQAGSGEVGHGGHDGSGPGDRVRARGGGDYVAEVIEYGAVDAVDAIRQLIVDDGVADRGHRTVLFDPGLRFAGVSCGAHPVYRTMCVIDLGIDPAGREGAPVRVASAR